MNEYGILGSAFAEKVKFVPFLPKRLSFSCYNYQDAYAPISLSHPIPILFMFILIMVL